MRLANQETMVIVSDHRRARTLGGALLITLLSAFMPGSGHLLLRRGAGWPILAAFVLGMTAAAAFVLKVPRAELVEYLLSTNVLAFLIMGCLAAAFVWLCVVMRTYELAKPRRLSPGKQFLGAFLVFVMCLGVTMPFAYGAYTANAQRNLLNALFPTEDSNGDKAAAGDANAINKPRLNIFLVGSDAGPDRIGTRTDTMVVASIDTKTGRTILFSLPRNIARAPFPSGSAMAKEFPSGFRDPRSPQSADYLLNGVYAYGTEFPHLAPAGPSRDSGLNLLMSSIEEILELELDYFIQVNMEGFASIVDALGGLDVNVGPERIPMGGIGPFGETVRPFGYIPPGQQHLTGEQALWFARSRTNSTDYVRMGRQRCLMQYLIDQKSPIDVLKNFQAVAAATTDSVSTNIPQDVLPPLVTLAGLAKSRPLESVAFDPNLPDPGQADGRFDTGNPDYDYVREVVRLALEPPPPPPVATTEPAPTSQPGAQSRQPTTTPKGGTRTSATPEAPVPTSLGETCNAATTE